MSQFPPGIVLCGYEMDRVLFSKYHKCLIVFALIDVTVRGQISAGKASSNEIFAGEQTKGPGEVVVSKMDLGQPECVCIIIYGVQSE